MSHVIRQIAEAETVTAVEGRMRGAAICRAWHRGRNARNALADRAQQRVTFHNAENGFCVLRAKARGHRDLVTVVGHAAIISAGEWITASGEWINDRAHGQQFKARFLKTSAPSSIDGIEKYLGSGMIRGIGPVYAKKMVKAFGDKVFDVIEAEPNRRTSPSTPAANGAVASRRDGGDDCGPAALALARGRR